GGGGVPGGDPDCPARRGVRRPGRADRAPLPRLAGEPGVRRAGENGDRRTQEAPGRAGAAGGGAVASRRGGDTGPMKALLPRFGALLLSLLTAAAPAAEPAVPKETAAEAKRRHQRVAERRKGIDIICHRGASEHAHENTLEAFRATFELGGDGNEFDIRATKDGVLVCFHDDMLDRLLVAHGDVSDYTWEQLRRFRFRSPGRFGAQR